MTVREGWRGRYLEVFEVGDTYQRPPGRTVTTTDNIWFMLLTQNTAPIDFRSSPASLSWTFCALSGQDWCQTAIKGIFVQT